MKLVLNSTAFDWDGTALSDGFISVIDGDLDVSRVRVRNDGDSYKFFLSIDGDDSISTIALTATVYREVSHHDVFQIASFESFLAKGSDGSVLAKIDGGFSSLAWMYVSEKAADKGLKAMAESVGSSPSVRTSEDDIFVGNADRNFFSSGEGDDKLFGKSGNDTLIGGVGGDILDGGKGKDRLTGGSDADAFIFSKGYGKDTITDFELGVDTLILDHHLWKGDLTESQVIGKFASFDGDGILLDFGKHELKLEGIFNARSIIDDIQIA
ncbi:MAG: calcium-binding protein [Pseudodonghicola sp.]